MQLALQFIVNLTLLLTLEDNWSFKLLLLNPPHSSVSVEVSSIIIGATCNLVQIHSSFVTCYAKLGTWKSNNYLLNNDYLSI